ncbi:MAG: transporter related protein [Conexibacter sp.]|nr:transporter related protein [Conexibacter sp.]
MSAPFVLEARGVVKYFGAVCALDGAQLQLADGEILALLGDNGAGKSTLIKCLTGVHRPDAGEIRVDGARLTMKSAADARAAGIETVYQDLALFDNLSPTQNFFAGREQVSGARLLGRLAVLRKRSMHAETLVALDRLGVRIPQDAATVGLMSGGQRQGIAVARAAAFAGRVVILDEPTAALGLRESRAVLDIVKRLPEQGISVILISHNLDHVTEVADRAVVMRRGRVVGEAVPSDETHEQLVGLIVNG